MCCTYQMYSTYWTNSITHSSADTHSTMTGNSSQFIYIQVIFWNVNIRNFYQICFNRQFCRFLLCNRHFLFFFRTFLSLFRLWSLFLNFWLIWYSTKRAYVIMICPSYIVVIRHRHWCRHRWHLCTALLATGFRIETSYLV